jgi:CubicO group peptidase (beta-lactamase class C family)
MNAHFDRGFGKKFPRTLKALEAARGDVFPDFAVAVDHAGKSFSAGAGCGPDSLFDLASVTKVLSTTTLVLIAEQLGLLRTDEPVKRHFPDFPSEKVLLSHLLDHSSGLPAWLPLHESFHEPASLGSFNARETPRLARLKYESEIMKSWDASHFEKEAVYSDLGFMLLGWALEKAAKAPLDALFQEWIASPSGLESLQFLPISPDVVPTEMCPWRGHVLRGEVHDDNCFVLGGVAGHAGLFGNVGDVLSAGKLWLQAYFGNETAPKLKPELVRKYWTLSSVPGSYRSLGWDGVSPKDSSTGKYFSASTRGHLGFTGTSLWIDPERKFSVVLLTNRVHPSRANEKIRQFRPLFHDTLVEELEGRPA